MKHKAWLWWAGLLITTLFGCGGETLVPTISEITLSDRRVPIGGRFYAIVDVHNPTGPVNGGSIALFLEEYPGAFRTQETVPVFGLEPADVDRARLLVDMIPRDGLVPGLYLLRLAYETEGERIPSRIVSAEVEITAPGR